MPSFDELRRADLERAHLLQVNRGLPGGGGVKVTIQPSNLRDKIKAVAERGHKEDGCGHPADWCPYCELLEILSEGR
jgi:ribosome modulation factor